MALAWCTALTTLPVPASPFVRIMAAPSEILLRASPRFRAPQTKGTLKFRLSMWFSSSAGVKTNSQKPFFKHPMRLSISLTKNRKLSKSINVLVSSRREWQIRRLMVMTNTCVLYLFVDSTIFRISTILRALLSYRCLKYFLTNNILQALKKMSLAKKYKSNT